MTKPVSPLRQRMIDDITLRNMSPNTRKAYIYAVRGMNSWQGSVPPSDLSTFLTKFDCGTVEALLAALSCRKGASHDCPSKTDDRRHAGADLSPHTQASYLQQVSLFARYFRTSPDALIPEHIRTYPIYLTNEKKLAPNSIHTAVAALRFLYRVTLKIEWTFGEDIPFRKSHRTYRSS